MRWILVVLCVAVMGMTAWHATYRGTDQAYLAGAPQIERKVDTGVRDAISALVGPEIGVSTSGREVTVSGPVTGEPLRDDVIAAASGTRLLGRLVDRMEILRTVSPFVFSAERTKSGELLLEGHVPSRALEDSVLVQARAIAGGAAVRSSLGIAAGAPEGDWESVVLAGMTALATMSSGSFSLSDLNGQVVGTVQDTISAEAVRAALTNAPLAAWDVRLDGPGTVETLPEFSALKTQDGAVILSGTAPDDETAEAFLGAAAAAGSGVTDGKLSIAGLSTPDNWRDLVLQGLSALSLSETGLLTISGTDVRLSAEVDSDQERAALDTVIGNNWDTEISVTNPTPAGDVVIEMSPDGSLIATGRLPSGLSPNAFAAMLPGLDVSAIAAEPAKGSADWTPAADALNIVLPRLEQARTRIVGNRLQVEGKLRRGFSENGSVAAVQTAMPGTWELDLSLRESAPLSEVVFSKRDDELVLSGVLPLGLVEDEALALTGITAGGEALATAGDGDADAWKAMLPRLGEALALFDQATGEITENNLAITGTLEPGYTPSTVQNWISTRLGDGWNVGLTAEETRANEGDVRVNLATAGTETFRRGYWLPDVSFAVSPENCQSEIENALSEGTIQFVTGSARIDQDGRSLLNRLAAVAVRCLNSSVIKLKIAGHTDALGNDVANQQLSVERAQAVLAELANRGVREDAMDAEGFGETKPVATNNTAEGRALNRRIEFIWSAQGD